MTKPVPIAIAKGDGIGPEIMDSVLRILNAAGASIEPHEVEVGEAIYLAGNSAGITDASWQTLRDTKIFLKAPITTPQGGGYKSLNVTIRKTLGLYANIRPCKSLAPFVPTNHPKMNLVIVRENEEDLYAGIEHRQTQDVYQCLKVVSRPGTEAIVRYAFEYARANGRKLVTCMVKDNIMKITDGLFSKVFREIGAEYPDIAQDVKIIDIGSALLADRPEIFDVIVTPNLYGDIISDIAAQVSGSVGLGGSANIGRKLAMFEAIHGSAPDIAGRDIANPSGLLNGALMMLVHIGQQDVAERIENAWLRTIEDGIHTGDIYDSQVSKEKVGTDAFTNAVIARLGLKPDRLPVADYASAGGRTITVPDYVRKPQVKTLVGSDLFVEWNGSNADDLAALLKAALGDQLHLKLITNRGVKVYPQGFPETFCTDHWRCRFVGPGQKDYAPLSYGQVIDAISRLNAAGIEVVKTENLYLFDGALGFSLGQGE
jgi:isocitrate dehydrogenase